MTTLRFVFLSAVILVLAAFSFGQKAGAAKKPVEAEPASASPPSTVSSSAAYAEVLLRRTELQSELESLVLEYTEDYPRVVELRQTMKLIDREIGRLARTPDPDRLTLALGRLVLRKIEHETALWKLLQTYKEEHPEVKRAQRKVDIFESAIAQILK